MKVGIPRGQEEHGLAIEVFNILIAKLFVVVVLQNLKAIGTLQLAVVQRLKADCRGHR
jgi:hypothetical protein